MDSRTIIIIFLILITVVLGGVAVLIGSQLSTVPETTPDTSAYDSPTITVVTTTITTTTIQPTGTGGANPTDTPTDTPTVTVSIAVTDTPVTTPSVSPTIPETALISDEVDRIIFGLVFMMLGILAIKFRAYENTVNGIGLMRASFVGRLEERRSRFEKSRKEDFENNLKD